MRFFLFLLPLLCVCAEEELELLTHTSHIYETKEEIFSYMATTGSLPILSQGLQSIMENENPLEEIFFISYFKDADENRPITFVFPGGPGGACGPEAICTFGPRRILTPSEGKSLLPPYELIDNPESLLPWTDLVFVDPIGTGFSTRDVTPEQMDKFFNIESDIETLGEFVHTFIGYFNRWNSPKYLCGGSYGTTRSAGLAEYLTFNGFPIHGIILLGSAIDFSTLVGQHNRFLPDSLLIPTFAATAWYHGRLLPDASLTDVIHSAKEFVFNTYIPRQLLPNKAEDDAFYTKLSEFLGLPEETVRRYQGRFDEALYTTEFLGPQRKVLGGLDTRYIGDLGTIQRRWPYDDPSYKDIQGLYCAFNDYLQNELETFRPFEKYVDFSGISNCLWDFSTRDSIEWPEFMQRIQRTLLVNPQMKVFVGSGYYDCRTPFAATDYCFDHLGLPESYEENLIFEYYEAGHGFIFDHRSLKKLKRDLVRTVY